MEYVAEIKKLLPTKKLVIGTNTVMKQLRSNGLIKIMVSSNCPEPIYKDLEHYTKLNKTELIRLDIPNEELGTICKKPFFVSMIGVKK
jgi:large subunit ribosomal protein L30e